MSQLVVAQGLAGVRGNGQSFCPIRMTSVIHYILRCVGCSNNIELPIEKLGPLFRSPAVVRIKDREPIVAVCAHCRQARTYELSLRSQSSALAELACISAWNDAGQLRCGEKTCDARLPVFAPVIAPMSAEEWEEYVSTWIWIDLKCPAGHKIQEPQ